MCPNTPVNTQTNCTPHAHTQTHTHRHTHTHTHFWNDGHIPVFWFKNKTVSEEDEDQTKYTNRENDREEEGSVRLWRSRTFRVASPHLGEEGAGDEDLH